MLLNNPDILFQHSYPYAKDSIKLESIPPKNLHRNFSFDLMQPLKFFRSSLDSFSLGLFNNLNKLNENIHPNMAPNNNYSIKNGNNINANIPKPIYYQQEIKQTNPYYDSNPSNNFLSLHKITDPNDNRCMNIDIDIDNKFCDMILQGNEEKALILMDIYIVDPFKFNQKYQTNPISLIYSNQREKMIQKIKALVYSKQIPYDFNFYCPNWSLKKYYPGFLAFQKKIFESMYSSLVHAFWSDETKEWVEF
jgi:hypothetical protein